MTMIAVEPGGQFREVPGALVTPASSPPPPGAVKHGAEDPAAAHGGIHGGAGLELGASLAGLLEASVRLEGAMHKVADSASRERVYRLKLAQAIYPVPIDGIPITLVGGNGTLDVPQQARPTLGRYWDVKTISISGFAQTVTTPGVSQPAVPATGVAQQNVNQFPVQVVISPNGATITNVSVNGVTVGTAAGTYTVPANGSISIAYSVATPTWVWTALTTTSSGTIKVYVNGPGLGNSRATFTQADTPQFFGKGQIPLRGNSDRLVFVAAGVTGQPLVSFEVMHVAEEFAGEYFR